MSGMFGVFDGDGLFQRLLISGVHSIPPSAVKLSDAVANGILQGPDLVWRIDGKGVVSSAEPELLPVTREQVEALRLRAYADPLTGSDRYFAEAQRMQVMGEDGWEGVRAAGVARFEAIQSLYPWSPPDPDMAEPQ
ncbi:hypothetical protein [Pseudomonas lurida]|uniref:Uncharacterized protein n=1 Tax=Pseudomonas lurida TaxID=244566 RepID=A0ABY9FYA9_9PSED|nr:hypothetical protein [Pseudomonas lurida]WLH08328.1 hypothetical protein PSH67_06620 [Pseudomonas lurida]